MSEDLEFAGETQVQLVTVGKYPLGNTEIGARHDGVVALMAVAKLEAEGAKTGGEDVEALHGGKEAAFQGAFPSLDGPACKEVVVEDLGLNGESGLVAWRGGDKGLSLVGKSTEGEEIGENKPLHGPECSMCPSAGDN